MLNEPFDDISRLRAQLRKLLDDSFPPARESAMRPAPWTPPADIHADERQVTVSLEVCGFSQDELEVTLEGTVLTVSGQPPAQGPATERVLHRERGTGPFTRAFTLARVPGDYSAHLKDGVLTITLTR